MRVSFIWYIQVGQPEPGETRGSRVFSINPENKEGKLSTKKADNIEQNLQSADINVSINNEKENILNLSSSVDTPNTKIGISDRLRKRSALSEALEAPDDSKFIQLNAEVKGKEAVVAFNPEKSDSILYKLFGNASTLTSGKSTSIVEVIAKLIGIPYTCDAQKVLTAVCQTYF